MTRRAFLLSLAAFGLLALPQPGRGDEHDSALQALRAGEVVSLDRILQRCRAAYYGRILEAELGRGGGAPWVYQVKMITPQGHVIKLLLNAKSTAILDVQGYGAEAARKLP